MSLAAAQREKPPIPDAGLPLPIPLTLALSPAGNSSDMPVPTAGEREQFRHEPGPRAVHSWDP